MNNFLKYDFDIKKIIFVYYNNGAMGSACHENRKNHGIVFFKEGQAVYKFSDGKNFETKDSQILYLPKGSTYTVKNLTAGKCWAINFELSSDIAFEPFVQTMTNPGAIREHFSQAKAFWEMKMNGYQTKCKSELFSILYSMQSDSSRLYLPSSKENLIMPAVEYIHQSYTKEIIRISHLSSLCKISPEYFRRIFSLAFGTSPVAYINSLKISRARELLESGDFSVSEAAYQSGFSDMSHFSREFKKATGVCPSEYGRKNN